VLSWLEVQEGALMAHNQDIWDKAKALFELGEPLSKIVLETGISKGQISKKSKSELWQKETMKQLVSSEVQNIIMAKGIRKQKETLNETEREVYNEAFIDLASASQIFHTDAMENQALVRTAQRAIAEVTSVTSDDAIDMTQQIAILSKTSESNRKQVIGNTPEYKKPKEDNELITWI